MTITLTPDIESRLLDCARDSIAAAASGAQHTCEAGLLASPYSGLFVTLWDNKLLRGCMGEISSLRGDLGAVVSRVAVSSAMRDPRFAPVSAREVNHLRIELSLLGEPEPCEMADLNPQKYGVIVEHGSRRGVLLPGVEGVDSAREQVEIARKKAGIQTGESLRLQRFQITKIAEGV